MYKKSGKDTVEVLDLYRQIHDIVSEMMENPGIRIEGMDENDQRRLCDLLEKTSR
jgi:hypothetical protein